MCSQVFGDVKIPFNQLVILQFWDGKRGFDRTLGRHVACWGSPGLGCPFCSPEFHD